MRRWSAVATDEDAPPFRSADAALGAAYLSEACPTYGAVSFDADRVDGAVELGWRLPFDWHAEAGLVMRRLRRTLTPRAMLIVDARGTVPETLPLLRRRLEACKALAALLGREPLYGQPDATYVLVVVMGWAWPAWVDNDAWAAHLDVSTRTLRNWRKGRSWASGKAEAPGILTTLEEWLDAARTEVSQSLQSTGFIA